MTTETGNCGKEIILNCEKLERRFALLNNGRLEEYKIEHDTDEPKVGDIYLGRISNLDPALQAAFVDIGAPKKAFLHYHDMLPGYDDLVEKFQIARNEAANAESIKSRRRKRQEPQSGKMVAEAQRRGKKISMADIPSIFKPGMTHPLPVDAIRRFAASVKRCVVVEEGDPVMYEALRVAGIEVENKPEMYRFGELNVARVRRIIAGDVSPEPAPVPGKPPQLCPGCPHRKSFEALRDLGCIVAGDIGCYTLGVMPPFSAMDISVCMGASITVGVGLRKVLPEAEARRVVSVIGDSTFWHSGINGLVELVYNPPKTGHVVIVLDNSTTAMTGMQEHPGTGRKLDHMTPATKLSIEKAAEGIGIKNIDVVDTTAEHERFKELLKARLASNECSLIIARRPCIIALAKSKQYAAKGE